MDILNASAEQSHIVNTLNDALTFVGGGRTCYDKWRWSMESVNLFWSCPLFADGVWLFDSPCCSGKFPVGVSLCCLRQHACYSDDRGGRRKSFLIFIKNDSASFSVCQHFQSWWRSSCAAGRPIQDRNWEFKTEAATAWIKLLMERARDVYFVSLSVCVCLVGSRGQQSPNHRHKLIILIILNLLQN